jgi:hypothetical protein
MNRFDLYTGRFREGLKVGPSLAGLIRATPGGYRQHFRGLIIVLGLQETRKGQKTKHHQV